MTAEVQPLLASLSIHLKQRFKVKRDKQLMNIAGLKFVSKQIEKERVGVDLEYLANTERQPLGI